jgi:hypothetical protein
MIISRFEAFCFVNYFRGLTISAGEIMTNNSCHLREMFIFREIDHSTNFVPPRFLSPAHRQVSTIALKDK